MSCFVTNILYLGKSFERYTLLSKYFQEFLLQNPPCIHYDILPCISEFQSQSRENRN